MKVRCHTQEDGTTQIWHIFPSLTYAGYPMSRASRSAKAGWTHGPMDRRRGSPATWSLGNAPLHPTAWERPAGSIPTLQIFVLIPVHKSPPAVLSQRPRALS